ncbi:hypothetical protein GTA08_BOTSDO03033 [Neofusicoccum parvum]|uniref:Uncharacterized protein n=3 Tax=Neofusicoccum TaxID=407951 RepID=R1G2R1_BOTPV|nr:hypothetical protein UCRNP2_7576 [Neofusicoccum parvum UCRNP2]GME32596.1 hypothetical protein GTA08_BOTSDO03033 [Neofusicoccum parvum]GME62829.1 hypothetical protein GTA08_BOTSDO03033 [Neofusicoccum parvum]
MPPELDQQRFLDDSAFAQAVSALVVSILVFKGEPLDYQRHRHTALSFRPLFPEDAGGPGALVVHITGPPGELGFQVYDRYDASRDPGRTLVKDVMVGTLRKEASKAEVVQLLAGVPIENWDREFNCQSWVEKGMRKLREIEWVSEEEFEQGLDGMIECILEADEDPEG